MNYTTRITLIICLLPVFSWAQEAEQEVPAAPVIVEQAQRDTFSATLWVSGTVISQNDARIAAETDGRINCPYRCG
jgi:multidrug efflux pump subunit AcrA (membrane-fusion protein)